MCNFILVNPCLHIVVTIAQHACDRVLKRVLKLSSYRLQTFLVKYWHLQSLQLCEDQGINGKLKNTCSQTRVCYPCDLYGDQALSSSLALKMSNKEDFKDFKAMTGKTDFFHPVNLSLSRVNRKLFQGSLQRFYFDLLATQEDPPSGKW